MPRGWIRDYETDRQVFFQNLGQGRSAARRAQALFRRDFTTPLRQAPDDGSPSHGDLTWADEVELPQGLEDAPFTAVRFDGTDGFVRSSHLVELAWVTKTTGKRAMLADLEFSDGRKAELLWGDLVQVRRREGGKALVHARGLHGHLDVDRLGGEPLLELYFIDVGQGDGVLVRFPEGHHLLVDGGLPRGRQMTGKNAADFVDWKFFEDYGDHRVRLRGMMASHSDLDHYGGLDDLLDQDPDARAELDCLGVDIEAFYHPGLARWENRPGATPPHKDGLGPQDGGFFVRLLGDRVDAEAAVVNGAPHELSGPWKSFVRAVLENDASTAVQRVGVRAEDLAAAAAPPALWPAGVTEVRVLAPVTEDRGAAPALPDLGDKGQNTNGHSICLRIDYDRARIVLTGDLNKKSMDWLRAAYGSAMHEWACDVAKACHHGSHDISLRFLEDMKAAATVISSGDNEGYAHPRPEVVAASAITGHRQVDAEADRLVTPLIYMTEIERSVELAQVNRLELTNLAAEGDAHTLLARPVEGLSDLEFLTERDMKDYDAAPDSAGRKAVKDAALARERPRLRQVEAAAAQRGTTGRFTARMPVGVVEIEYPFRAFRGSRVANRTHYGLVNVRTDGEAVMCASKRESGEAWTVHSFSARFT